jgi:activator of HSP90 ATPase
MSSRNELTDRVSGPSRREAIIGAVIALGGAALGGVALGGTAQSSAPAAANDVSHVAEAIHQEVVFKASRKRVYDALMDTKQFDKVIQLSGAMQTMSLGTAPTEISRDVGGAFTLFGGHIVGRQVELVQDTRIVEAWRVIDWDPGIYSIARFQLDEQGPGTKLVFDHTGFPKGWGKHLAEGWNSNYWEPLAKFLA